MRAKDEARRITGQIAKELERFVLDTGSETERLTKALAQCAMHAGAAETANVDVAPESVRLLRARYETVVEQVGVRDIEISRIQAEAVEREKALKHETVRLREVLSQIRGIAIDRSWDDSAARHEIYDLSGSA